MELDILNISAEKIGRTIKVHEEYMNATPNEHVVYLAVKQYLAAQRTGTHRVKNRKEVKGASRKLHKQKGTGGSRKGNIRNPLYKGGGTIFGPKPRDYSFKLNKQVKNQARFHAFCYKFLNQEVIVLEDPTVLEPKTKIWADFLVKARLKNKKSLMILDDIDESVYLGTRNIPNLAVTYIEDVNTYDVTNADVLILSETAAKLINGIEVETEVVTEDNIEKN